MAGPIRIVLVEPSHPGNIGAAARAMKTMGLDALSLVAPLQFPHADATARAAGAGDLLAKATVCTTLDEALAGCRLVIGSSTRSRSLDWPPLTPREAAVRLHSATADGPVALLFGRERSGLSNAELDRCQAWVTIPTAPGYGSLNLAAAVQVLAYELRLARLEHPEPELRHDSRPATADELAGFFSHLEQTLVTVGFLDPQQPGRVMRRLRRLFARAGPEEVEIHILRGILKEVTRAVEQGARQDSE